MKKLSLIFAALLYSGMAVCGSAKGQVSGIVVGNGLYAVMFTLTAKIDDTPKCNEAKRFAINMAKPGGMVAYMAILEAKKQGYDVTVRGLNTCVAEWRSEDIEDITLE